MASKALTTRSSLALLVLVFIAATPSMVDAQASAIETAAPVATPASVTPAGVTPADTARIDFEAVVGVETAGMPADAGIDLSTTALQVDVGF